MKKDFKRKAKEPVTIRFKKLANGNQSIYLDIYTDGRRSYEFLKLYLVPEIDNATKVQNENTMTAACAIKAQRIIDIANGKAGIKVNNQSSKILLRDWVQIVIARKKDVLLSHSRLVAYKTLGEHLDKYIGKKRVRLHDVDIDFLQGFIKYLAMTPGLVPSANRRTLSHGSAMIYISAFKTVLQEAERDGLLIDNPARRLRPEDVRCVGVPKKERVYLDTDEVAKLAATPCGQNDVKRAFMFACYCGLRVSDIRTLKWGELVTIDGELYVVKRMQKTKEPISVPLSVAKYWLPNREGAADDDLVYNISSAMWVNRIIKKWANDAGIKNKHVTFHTSRHTFATMLLTAGADIYTTKELLGHKDINSTQVYAKLVNSKKTEAISLLKSTIKRG